MSNGGGWLEGSYVKGLGLGYHNNSMAPLGGTKNADIPYYIILIFFSLEENGNI